MSSKGSSKKLILVLLAIAVSVGVPLSMFLTAKYLKVDKIDLPDYYLPEGVQTRVEDGKTVTDTVYHQVSDITLTNQLGNKVSLNKDLAGKVVVINFFFARCPSVCPKLTSNMILLQNAFRKNPKVRNELEQDVQLVSMTVNPEHDSFPVLRDYADRFNVNHDHWWFLTGSKQDIYNFARNELRVSVQPTEGGVEDFIHTEKIVLIDKDRYIRGYYDGLDSADIKRCAEDVVILTLEKKHKKR
ncbi:SCO family protein [Polluticoccus soli]|uniref:SCO family protein n=1 Tax=Polluticoccus soli TaxID=3034150 RepID=UPI0023E1A2E5|nr:SCO family protein [Flavipsychrobacter sp. JY13-12]